MRGEKRDEHNRVENKNQKHKLSKCKDNPGRNSQNRKRVQMRMYSFGS
jgi:hypothetical protein